MPAHHHSNSNSTSSASAADHAHSYNRHDVDMDETFEQACSGASLTYPVCAGDLKVGQYVCIDNHPCKLVDVDSSKMGKHGHAKVCFTGVDIFNGKTRETSAPASHNLDAPVVSTRWYMVLDVSRDGEVSLLDNETNATRYDLNLPAAGRLADTVRAMFSSGKTVLVQVLKAMDQEMMMSFKEECGK